MMTADRGEPGLEEVEVVEVGGEARVQQDGKERQIRRGMLNSAGRAASQKHADRAGQGRTGRVGTLWVTTFGHGCKCLTTQHCNLQQALDGVCGIQISAAQLEHGWIPARR